MTTLKPDCLTEREFEKMRTERNEFEIVLLRIATEISEMEYKEGVTYNGA